MTLFDIGNRAKRGCVFLIGRIQKSVQKPPLPCDVGAVTNDKRTNAKLLAQIFEICKTKPYDALMNSDDIILKILQVENEQKNRNDNALAAYNRDKVHLKQMAFHKCQKRNRWVFGGNRSGKTECGAVETVWIARGIHPFRANKPNTEGWVVSVTYEVQRDVAQAKILKYLEPRYIEDVVMQNGKKDAPEYGVIDYIVVRNAFGGLSKIGFKSCEQGREKFQGASLDYVWFDEEPPEDIYDECRMRVFDKCGNIFGTMTPLKGLTWVYDKIEMNVTHDKEVWCEHVEWSDNPYLDADEIENMLANTSSDAQQTRRFGKFFEGSGLVYPEFDKSVNVIEPFAVPKEWQCAISIDPGLTNPTSAHFYAVDFDGNVFVVGEHYEAGASIDTHVQKIYAVADSLNWARNRNGKLEALIDSAATQRTLASEKSVAELFFEKGIAVNTKVNKDLYSGVQRVRSLINAKPTKFFVFENCVNMIEEFLSYRWGDGDKPRKVKDHAMDELRYFVMSRPDVAKPPQTEKSVIQKDKETLGRNLKREGVWKTKY